MTNKLTPALLAAGLLAAAPAGAQLKVGDKAKLFQSVDENLAPVDMAALIKGRPLVLAIGSAS